MPNSRKSILGLSAGGFHTLSYTEWGNPAARRIVVCVHGLTRNARDFDTLAQALEPHYRVICPDVVGRGASGWLANKQDYGYPQYLADMTALIARVSEPLGSGATLDWVGTSMGGLIGMMLAAQNGSPIRRMVMNDVGAVIPRRALERIAMYVGKSPTFTTLDDAERYVRSVSAPFGPLTDSQWRHLTVHNSRQTADGRWVMNYDPGIAVPFANIPPQDMTLWEFWDRVSCPVLLLRGAASDLFPAQTAREMCARKPATRLVEFDAIGHAPALMATEQIGAICDFLLAGE